MGAGRPGSGALPSPTTRPFGRATGAHYPLAVGAGGAGMGTRHQPHSRALASWLCALWGGREGARGGRLLPGYGASGVRGSPTPNYASFQACGPGPLPTGCGCGGWGRANPSPVLHRALFQAGIARCGGNTRVPRGGKAPAWVPGVWGRAISHPRPLVLSGVRPGPTTHWLWVRGVRAWGLVTNPTARPLASWLCALLGRHEVPGGGGACCPDVGRPGSGVIPSPDHSSFRACGRGPLPTRCGCGACGVGDPSPTPQRALLRAGFARCGGGMRVPVGGASCLGVGRPGSGALRPRLLVLSGLRPGPTTHLL